jgi:hypothetical protein
VSAGNGLWRSLEAYLAGGQGVVGSNPTSPTNRLTGLSVLRTSVRFMNMTSRNTRTWTDEQLRVAVAAETSWRAVARVLGLAQSSTNGIWGCELVSAGAFDAACRRNASLVSLMPSRVMISAQEDALSTARTRSPSDHLAFA